MADRVSGAGTPIRRAAQLSSVPNSACSTQADISASCVAIERAALPVRQVVGAERDHPPVGRHNVYVAQADPFHIEGPRVLKGHTGEADCMATGFENGVEGREAVRRALDCRS